MIRRLILLMASAGALAGCSRPTRVELGGRDQVLHIGNGAEPKDIDPQTLQTSNEYTISTALFEGLVTIANDGQTILPGVAQRWEMASDGLTYTFHLRSDACWSDGSPVTAQDFLYSFRRAFSPMLAGENALYGFAIAGSRDYADGKNPSPESLGVRADGPRTFVVRLDYPAPYLLYILSGAPFVPVPRAVVERFRGGDRQGTAWTRPGNLVGNGAFELTAWHPGLDLIVAKNPRYWDRRRVRLDEIHFYPLDNVDAEERAYRAGELHATHSLPVSKIAGYRQEAAGPLHVTPQLNTVYLLFNTAGHPFDDRRVRRAFALAIDRERLIPRILQERGAPAHSLTRPGTDHYFPPRFADFDPVRARFLLAEAGYPRGTGFPSVEFRVPNDFSPDLGQALQEAWRHELGIAVKFAPGEKKVLFDDLGSGNFQLAAMPFFYAINAPEMILLVPLSDSPFNFARWSEPAFDRAYRQATHAATQDARRAAFDAMEGLLYAEAPYVPLYFVNQCFAVSPMVRGWRDNPLGQIDWRELSLEPEK